MPLCTHDYGIDTSANENIASMKNRLNVYPILPRAVSKTASQPDWVLVGFGHRIDISLPH